MSKFVPSGSRSAREQSLQEARRREREAELARKKKEKKIILLVVAIAVIVAIAVTVTVVLVKQSKGQGNNTQSGQNETSAQNPAETWPEHEAPAMADLDFSAVDAASVTVTQEKTNYVRMTIKDHGEVIIRLFPEVAPITVDNFQDLVAQGFYDGLTFHRIVDEFMAQGGDPSGNGSGESPNTIRGEFSVNGWENNLSHVRGVISMARTKVYDSASCQFFIMLADKYKSSLDGSYAAFGYVCAGMETIDSLTTVERSVNSLGEIATPVEPVVIEKIEFVTVGE